MSPHHHVNVQGAGKIPASVATSENHITIASHLSQNSLLSTLNPFRGYAYAMSSSRERLLEFWPPTDEFRRLAEMAAAVCREQTVSAQDKPVTKLKSTSQCEDVQKELGKSYKDMVSQKITLSHCYANVWSDSN